MNNFVEDLKEYFKNTPREKVLEDWEKFQDCDENGVLVDDFLKSQSKFYWKIKRFSQSSQNYITVESSSDIDLKSKLTKITGTEITDGDLDILRKGYGLITENGNYCIEPAYYSDL